MSNLKKQARYGAGARQAKLNIAGLQAGIYFIEIFGGRNKERQQLVIQK